MDIQNCFREFKNGRQVYQHKAPPPGPSASGDDFESQREKKSSLPSGTKGVEVKAGLAKIDTALGKLKEKRDQWVTETLLDWARWSELNAKKTPDPAQRDQHLAEARFYREAAREPNKPTRRQFFAYAERLWDMYGKYHRDQQKIKDLIDTWRKKKDTTDTERGRNIVRLEAEMDANDQEWARRMQRYADEKFGNGAQLELARSEIIGNYSKMVGGLDGDEMQNLFYPPIYLTDSVHMFARDFTTSEASRVKRPPGFRDLGEEIYYFRLAAKTYWKERARRDRSAK